LRRGVFGCVLPPTIKILLDWDDNVLKKYYWDETLKSDLARSTFLLSDRLVA